MSGHNLGISPLSRRAVLANGGALAGSLALRSVGSAQTPDTGTPNSATPEGEFPRTITHAMGDVTIPAIPHRMAATSDFNDLDFLLSLGIEPVIFGFSNAWDSGAMPWQTAATNVPHFDASVEIDFEALKLADPDLIISMPVEDAAYETASDIAPTLVLDWDIDWRAGLRQVGAATGLDREAERQIELTGALLADASEQLATIADKQLMVAFMYGDTFYIWGDETAPARLFQELGLNFVGGPDGGLTAASLEQVDLVSGAEILLSVSSDPDGLAIQESNPLFKSLPAVTSGGYGVLDVVQSRALADGQSPISLPWVMPDFISLLKSLAAGEGTFPE